MPQSFIKAKNDGPPQFPVALFSYQGRVRTDSRLQPISRKT